MTVLHYTGNVSHAVMNYRRSLIRKYTVVLLLMIVGALVSLLLSWRGTEMIREISREGYGNGSFSIPVEVEAEYGEATVTGNANITIPARELSEEEAEQILDRYGAGLPDRIVPENEIGQRVVQGDLVLPKTDGEYGIEISWSSSDPAVLTEEGKVDAIALTEESETVTLSADLSLNGVIREVTMDLLILDDPALYEGSIRNRLRQVIEGLSAQAGQQVITLPEETEDGIHLNWKRGKETYLAGIPVMGGFLLIFLYLTRYRVLEARARKYRESVIADFPSIPDKMILLLNSGMTSFNALMRICSDYEKKEAFRDRPIGNELAEIGRRVRETNSNIIREWKTFASRMESGDMLRFCTILEDNINKGSELSVKLEAESITLRESRKKDIQKVIRMIDSRMMIPMMVMLFSLVLVTIAPALMGF